MPLSEFEIKQCEKAFAAFMKQHGPPDHVKNQLDFGHRINKQSIELFEIRPDWQDPSSKTESPFAKATYVKKNKIWKVYWMRADLKWHSYPPVPEVKTIDEFFDVVGADEHACFFG